LEGRGAPVELYSGLVQSHPGALFHTSTAYSTRFVPDDYSPPDALKNLSYCPAQCSYIVTVCLIYLCISHPSIPAFSTAGQPSRYLICLFLLFALHVMSLCSMLMGGGVAGWCVQLLDPRWNVVQLGWNRNIAIKSLEDAYVLHWNGALKPWRKDGLYKDRWKPYSIS
jgi:hypothetical protein